jgi:glycosyltransferase involved in cell wall biosynthesis
MIDKVLVLSYYNPWISGGGHRPICLLEQDLYKGRKVFFLFESNAEVDKMSDFTLYRNPNLMLLMRDKNTERLIPCNEQAREAIGDYIEEEEFILSCKPDYARSHNPVASYLKLLNICEKLNIPHIYDQMDFWDGFAVQPWGENTERQYIRNATRCVTISKWLIENSNIGKDSYVIPNGIKSDFLDCIRIKNSDEVRKRSKQTKKTILYSGAIWPDWFDWDIVKYLVLKRPEYKFVFVGAYKPSTDEDDGRNVVKIVQELSELPNVEFLGQVLHHELIELYRKANLGIIPFVVNKVTEACSPLKCFEYLGSYLPVVSTNLPEIKDYPMVKLVNSKEEFISAIDEKINKQIEDDNINQVDNFLNMSVWKRRSDEFDKVATIAMEECKKVYMNS